jgi:heat shock protein HslJ
MKWLSIIALVFVGCALTCVSAQSTASSSQEEKAGHSAHASNLAMGQWRFVSVAGTAVRAVGRKQPYLKFEESKNSVTGYTGCNRLSGRYTADESALMFQQVVSTRMACIGDSLRTAGARGTELCNRIQDSRSRAASTGFRRNVGYPDPSTPGTDYSKETCRRIVRGFLLTHRCRLPHLSTILTRRYRLLPHRIDQRARPARDSRLLVPQCA